jgi:non-canonical purine NTP pyrophosphatase (RdgB/HAM1 family)
MNALREQTQLDAGTRDYARRVDEFSALLEASRDLSIQTGVDALLQTLLERVTNLVGCSSASVFLLDQRTGDAVVAATLRGTLRIGTRFPATQGIAGRMAETRRPVRIDDYQKWEHRVPEIAAHGVRAILMVPMICGGELLGALGVSEYSASRTYNDDDARVLWLFAAQAASGLRSVQLLEEERKRADQLLSDNIERRRTEEALRRSEERYRHLSEDLDRRVQERTAELAAANQELEAFGYSVSHDLRGPLRIIEGFSRLLEDEYGDVLDGAARQYVEGMRISTVRMAQLIQDLLNLSRITRNRIERTSVDLADFAREAAEDLQKTDPLRRVKFHIPAHAPAAGDPTMLRILVEHLLGNAWKYTSRHVRGEIELGMREADGETVFYVRDDGAGFDMEYASKLFAPFQRLHDATEFDGTGIGLAIVERIVRRHGGRIWGEGLVEDGATFSFTLAPKRSGHADDPGAESSGSDSADADQADAGADATRADAAAADANPQRVRVSSASAIRTLVLATTNKGKLRDFRALFQGSGIAIELPGDHGVSVDVEETGSDFRGNALLKARAYAAELPGVAVLADDSGLVVEALDGEPGVRSARYAGEPCDDGANNRLVLEKMRGVEDRRAAFVVILALVRPDRSELLVEGRCEGTIADSERGENGFGYDAIFFRDDLGCTFGEAAPSEKNARSHRAAAVRKLLAALS